LLFVQKGEETYLSILLSKFYTPSMGIIEVFTQEVGCIHFPSSQLMKIMQENTIRLLWN